MRKLIKDICKWQRSTFPYSNVTSKYQHFLKEVRELEEALEIGSIVEKMEEIADCAILLIGISDSLDIDFIKSIETKHEINKKRNWGIPDNKGIVEHI